MTNSALSGEPAPGGNCRICGAKLRDGSLHCQHCGATYGESNRCPHCRSVSDVEPSSALRYRCRVCGGPRVPMQDANVVRSGREIPLLSRAQRAQVRATAWRIGALAVAGFGVLSLLVALLVWALVNPGLLGTLGMLGALAVPFVVSLLAWRRAAAYRKELLSTLDQAWMLVASDVLASSDAELTATRLAETLRIDETKAELLLAELDVHDFIRARVTDEGDIVYSSQGGGRVRVDDGERVPELEPALDSTTAHSSPEELEATAPPASVRDRTIR